MLATPETVNSCGLATRLRSQRSRRRLQDALPLPPAPTCHLLELPAELRDMIWIHAVTEWDTASAQSDTSSSLSSEQSFAEMLVKRPIRMDRLNRPCPAPITLVSQQVRAEALPLYYQENVWECWRPQFWLRDWRLSTLMDWISCIGPKRTSWLRHIVLLYKHESELEYDVRKMLLDEGFMLRYCTIDARLEMSEYEKAFAELGLPRHFGRKRKRDYWMAGNAVT